MDDVENEPPLLDAFTSDNAAPGVAKKQRGRKKVIPEEPLDADDGNFPELLRQTVNLRGGKGLKTMLKRLWMIHGDAVGECSLVELKEAFYESSMSSSAEGIKLLATFMPIIGVGRSLNLVIAAVKNGASNAVCQRYGEVALTAWKWAVRDDDQEFKRDIENEYLTKVAQFSVLCKEPISKRFYNMLIPFVKERKTKPELDRVISAQIYFLIDANIRSLNNLVRYQAALLLFLLFPLIQGEEEEGLACLGGQFQIFEQCLNDECYPIRSEAAKMVLNIISTYFVLFPKEILKSLLIIIVDQLANDECLSVRLGVLEGMQSLVMVPACVNTCSHALSCILPNAINDKNERVRLAAVKLIGMLRQHRYIKQWEVLPREELIARLDIETKECVRREVVRTLHALTKMDDVDEKSFRVYVNQFVDVSRTAALTYVRLLFPLELINVDECAEMAIVFCKLAYRILRIQDDREAPEEDSKEWNIAKVYLECAVLLTFSMRMELSMLDNADKKNKLVVVQNKIFDRLFQHYKRTSLENTLLTMASWFPKPHLKKISEEMLEMLEDPEVDDNFFDSYVELVANFNIEKLFDIVTDSLAVLENDLRQTKKANDAPQVARKTKTKKAAVEVGAQQKLSKALKIVKCVLQNYSSNALITSSGTHIERLINFHKQMEMCKFPIEARFKGEKMSVTDEILVDVFEVRQILALLVLNCCNDDESQELRSEYVQAMCNDLSWIEGVYGAAAHLVHAETTGQRQECSVTEFFITFGKGILNCFKLSLSAYNFEDVLVPLRAEHDADETSFEQMTSYPKIISRVILSFCSRNTPSEMLVPLLRAAANLCDEEYKNASEEMVRVLKYSPLWLAKCYERGENIDEKETCEAFRTLLRCCVRLEDAFEQRDMQELLQSIVAILTTALTKIVDDSQYLLDPHQHDYEIPAIVSLFVHRLAMKEKGMLEKMHEELSVLVASKKFSSAEGLDTDDCLIRFGAAAQLAILCDPEFVKNKTKGKRKLSESVENILVLISEEVERLVDKSPPEDNLILNEVQVILRGE